MDKTLSEDSLDLLRTMVQSEAWRIYESLQQEQIKDLRVLATSVELIAKEPFQAIAYAANAQGREDAITHLKDKLYGKRSKESSSNG